MNSCFSPVRCAALGAAVALIGCRPASEQPTQAEPDAAEATLTAAGTVDTERADELTCSYPVTADDTPASLKQRFGDAARVETIYGPEGIELPGVALWPDDPERRVEVVFSEEGERLLSFAGISGEKSAWRLAGLALGDPLASAQRANGRPFELWGFSWDYGGYASDLRGGKLAALPGGCRAIVRFDLPESSDPPSEVLGEVRLASDDPLLAGAEARIVELALTFDRE